MRIDQYVLGSLDELAIGFVLGGLALIFVQLYLLKSAFASYYHLRNINCVQQNRYEAFRDPVKFKENSIQLNTFANKNALKGRKDASLTTSAKERTDIELKKLRTKFDAELKLADALPHVNLGLNEQIEKAKSKINVAGISSTSTGKPFHF